MLQTVFVAGALGLTAVGCAHRTRIVSSPAGASVFIGGQFVGITPCSYETPASELRDDTPIRLERRGYQTAEGQLETAILPSRIVGGIFTVGLIPLFKWPHTYKSVQTFTLRPLSAEERLQQLDSLRQQGKMTDQEYRELRLDILGAP